LQKRIFLICACLLIVFVLSGCSTEEVIPDGTEPDLKVVTTIYPLADFVKQLGGDRVEVSHLLPAGSSPHTYEPTVEKARLVERADLFVYVGADLDNWAVNMAEAADTEIAILDLSEQADLIEAVEYHDLENDDLEENSHEHDHNNHDHHDSDHDHGPEDPHFWLDPLVVRDSICPAIHKELVALAPGSEDYFKNRLEQYQQDLNVLHEEIVAAVDGFSRDSFIAFHSAWQYFADRYGLEELAVIAQFPGQEPSAGWIAELVELIREKEIGAIFTEPQFSPELAERIAEESGTEVKIIDPLGGEGVPRRETYLELMRFNLSVFKEAME